MHLNFERPGHGVDKARLPRRQVGDVARTGEKIGQEFPRRLVIDENEQREKEREIDQVRRLQTGDPSEVVLAQADP